MSLLPHLTQPITTEPASYEMRAWMESVQSFIESFGLFNSVSVRGFYTALDFDFINASNGAVITLPESPAKSSVIIVRNDDGSLITINGNGRKINKYSEAIARKEGRAFVIHYFSASDEWLIR